MVDTHLRIATPADIPALADTFIRAVNLSIPGRKLGDEFYDLQRDIAPGDPGSSAPGKLWTRFQKQFSDEQIWLAEVDGRVAGYVSWYAPTRHEAVYKPGEITFLFVHPSFHGRGIGTMLFDHAKQDVASLNLAESGEVLLEVRCFEKNPAGLRLYERGGFTRRHGAEEWHDRVQEYLALLVWLK